MPTYSLNVNGEDHVVEAEADMPLLWVLRDILDLTGTKYGCGVAQCRACGVHLDGQMAFSCQTPVSAVGSSRVVTIEGLSPDRKAPLVAAWEAEDVPQCGYCQPGQIMAAAALLSRTPNPSDEEIAAGMNPNLCRCGTYNRIRRAVARAAGDQR